MMLLDKIYQIFAVALEMFLNKLKTHLMRIIMIYNNIISDQNISGRMQQ